MTLSQSLVHIVVPTLAVGSFVAVAALARDAAQPQTLRQLYGVPPIISVDPPHTAVILVDAQQAFRDGPLALPELPTAVHAAGELLEWARDAGVHVVHVRQVGKPGAPLFAPGSPSAAPIAELDARPGELVVGKPTGGGFTQTDLDTRLRALGVDAVIVAGFMTHHAVDMTARAAGALGYRVVIATDATATRDLPSPAGTVRAAEVQRVALASLGDRFAELHDVAEIRALPIAARR